ncbi:MAG: DUF1177 domain-containing protein [Firmicutes bacterium]|nr:DUF1177 domain-containing protein [Bacillota bacterium]
MSVRSGLRAGCPPSRPECWADEEEASVTFRQTLEVMDLLDSPRADGAAVREYLLARGACPEEVRVTRVEGAEGATDFVTVTVPGLRGKRSRAGDGSRPEGACRGGSGTPVAPTLGIIGRLGGVGARPGAVGLVSDADGAVAALAAAAKLLEMRRAGDRLEGDVIVATHVCPDAPTEPHDPVPFMGSPVDMATMNGHEVSPEMDGILSIDATKGNRVANFRGIAITPTVKEGWILRVSEDLLDLLAVVTGEPPRVVPVTMQDITPYGNGVFHLNSILQPATATSAPVVGVATTAVTAVPGCATGASRAVDIAAAATFAVEVAKGFGAGRVSLYDETEFRRLVALYGSMRHLQELRVVGERD